MEKYYKRLLTETIMEYLLNFPVVAILGPRQCGKSTLAKEITSSMPSVFLDMEDDSDLQKITEPKLFFEANKNKLVCIDEIQLKPDLFPALRGIVDKNKKNGQILILGSASRDLIKQSSESLAGRIAYLELTPFLESEIKDISIDELWLKGGFPRSILASNNKFSYIWRKNFIQTYLERDIPQLGFNIPAQTLKRLWTMIAHISGQLLNSSKLGNSIGVSHTTLRKYIDLLTQTYMVRVLMPYQSNIKKRLVKSPKIYIRDTGILHNLLQIETYNELLGNPVFGNSYESFVIEQICSRFEDWEQSFYRTSAGAEIDLVLTKGTQMIAIEIKASATPRPTKGFWNAIEDLKPTRIYVIGIIKDSYFIREDIKVTSLREFLGEY